MITPLRIYKVTPVAGEPGRYWVPSESEPHAPPHLVDLNFDGHPYCSCAIIHNRTDADAECKHIRAVMELCARATANNEC